MAHTTSPKYSPPEPCSHNQTASMIHHRESSSSLRANRSAAQPSPQAAHYSEQSRAQLWSDYSRRLSFPKKNLRPDLLARRWNCNSRSSMLRPDPDQSTSAQFGPWSKSLFDRGCSMGYQMIAFTPLTERETSPLGPGRSQ